MRTIIVTGAHPNPDYDRPIVNTDYSKKGVIICVTKFSKLMQK